tara:strand:+ start:19754 stop:20164 length:411 start_codon:yes stop_codon:yes gene_type:complete
MSGQEGKTDTLPADDQQEAGTRKKVKAIIAKVKDYQKPAMIVSAALIAVALAIQLGGMQILNWVSFGRLNKVSDDLDAAAAAATANGDDTSSITDASRKNDDGKTMVFWNSIGGIISIVLLIVALIFAVKAIRSKA